MSPPVLARAVALVNKPGTSNEVANFIARHVPKLTQRMISRRISAIILAGRLTPELLKLECMALATLASRLFEEPCGVAITDKNGEILMGSTDTIVHKGKLTPEQIQRILDAIK
jgi:hypothetical protein